MSEIIQRSHAVIDMVMVRLHRTSCAVLRKPDPYLKPIQWTQLELPLARRGLRR